MPLCLNVLLDIQKPLKDNASNFIKYVIEPVSGPLPPNVKVKEELGPNGEHQLIITHTVNHAGTPLNLKYKVILKDHFFQSPDVTSLTEENILQIPESGWTEHTLHSAQNTWRRLTIADPILNRRFSSSQIQLEKYQEEGVRETIKSLEEKEKALTVMATATGKTLVAFKVMEHLFDSDKAKKTGKEKPAIVFLVNNRIILKEAEEKLQALYNGKYKTSRVYEGEEDFSGDIIFATPSSLASSSRLNALLGKRRLLSVVFDEVHHLPAGENTMIFRRVMEESINHNWGTKMLGLTATETRPDRVSVISYFGREVAFDYPITRGWEEGSLVPMTYLAGDQDINPHNRSRIEPGTPLYNAYKANRYSDSRFPNLLSLYQKHTDNLKQKRSLILSPNIERAKALAEYFRKSKIHAITLTSEERTRDPQWFDHHYEAWKTGQWPQNSPYKNEPIPEVVTAVDIFREGTDAPAINFLMLWADTNSSIRFMQGIGRGLRVAPFKTHLTIVDTVGLFRKIHVLSYLGTFFESKGLGGTGIQKEQGGKGGEFSHHGISLGHEVTHVLKDYFAHVPHTLEARYGSYSLVPANELSRLDTYIAQKSGFSSVGEMNTYLDNFIEKLKQSGSREDAKIFHDKFQPSFPSDTPNSKVIEVQGATLLVFNRMYDLLSRIDPVTCDEHIYQLFPEFDPQIEAMVRNIAKNLSTLRTKVFGVSAAEMSKKLLHNLKSSRIKISDELEISSNMDAEELERGTTQALSIVFAEGRGSALSFKERQGNERFIADKKMGAGASFWQDPVIEFYLYHPKLSGKLTPEDFRLPPADFLNRLASHNILIQEVGLRKFYKDLKSMVGEYSEGLKTLNPEDHANNRKKLIDLISSENNLDLIDPYEITSSRADSLWQASELINATIREEKGHHTNETIQLRKSFDKLLDKAGLYFEETLPDVHNTKIIVERSISTSGNHDFEISINTTGTKQGPKLSILVRRDVLGRPHAFISNGDNQISHYYKTLSPFTKTAFLNGLRNSLDFVGRIYDEQLVYVFPQDLGGQTFFKDAFQHTLDTTSWDILGQLIDTHPNASARSLDFTINGIKDSRISFLNPETIRLMRSVKGDMKSYADKLAYLYITNYENTHLLRPNYESAIAKLNNFKPTTPKMETAVTMLKQNLTEQINRDITGLRRSQAMQQIFKTLDVSDLDKPLTEKQLELAAVQQLIFFDRRGDLYAPHKAEIGSLFNSHRFYLHTLAQREREIPPEVKNEFDSFISLALEDHQKNGDFTELSSGPAKQLNKKITELSKNAIEIKPTVEPQKIISSKQQPPYFNSDGELIFFLSGKKSKTVHSDPHCLSFKEETPEAMTRDHIKGYLRGFKLCKVCKTPQIPYWEEMEKAFNSKYGGRSGAHIWTEPEKKD